MKRVEELYPNAQARRKADDAIAELPDTDTMQLHIQVWLDTYTKYAGPRKK